MVSKLVSGGQTGVDRAALDVALELGIPIGGWCPKGRRAEDGRIPDRYPLAETPSLDYSTRTEWNVRDSDFTLILTAGEPAGETWMALRSAGLTGKPYALVDLTNGFTRADVVGQVRGLMAGVKVLNVAGPRASGHPGVYEKARAFLHLLLARPLPSADPETARLPQGDSGLRCRASSAARLTPATVVKMLEKTASGWRPAGGHGSH